MSDILHVCCSGSECTEYSIRGRQHVNVSPSLAMFVFKTLFMQIKQFFMNSDPVSTGNFKNFSFQDERCAWHFHRFHELGIDITPRFHVCMPQISLILQHHICIAVVWIQFLSQSLKKSNTINFRKCGLNKKLEHIFGGTVAEFYQNCEGWPTCCERFGTLAKHY